MKLTSSTTTTLLPFAPHQPMIPSSHSSQRASPRSSVHSRVPIISSFLYSMPSSASRLRGLFDVPRRRNSLRVRPSTISETSYESESSCASSASSSSSSFPNTSPTSCSTPPSSLPPSPPPSSSSFGKSRPLPKIPKSPPPPQLPATSPPPSRPRSPPPAWSPPQTIPVSRRSPPPTSSSPRPQRPKVMLPPTPSQRLSSATLRPPSRIYSPPIDDDMSVTALFPTPPRVRPLPRRPPPPGPPGEDTPVAQFGRVRWIAEPPEDDESSTQYDDRRAIDWDLIDEVMTHAS